MSELAEASILEKCALLCLKNAKQYIKDADILFSFKSYQHSLALTILSDVELGKAVVYHLLSKDLILGDTLPSPYQLYFREKEYGLFASETWWLGLTIASNIEYLVQNLLDISELGEVAANVGDSAAFTQTRITELVKKMNGENSNFEELEEYWTKAFFVDHNLHEAEFGTVDVVEKTLVKERISRAKQRIKIGQPFLSLSLTKAPRRIAEHLLGEAFQSILPLRSKISQFTIPLKSNSEEAGSGVEQI
ncbi:MAG: AbiV family abortive infection protein [Candidatus Bathyarchaeia archaeon]